MIPGEAPPPPKKQGGPGPPWLDWETAHLIDAYEDKWYALRRGQRRGQLRAHQWEEVAAAVAAGLGLPRPSKSGTQCRHKIEKLRQRYRAERQRPGPSRWAFFDRMDRMERGPLPVSVRPPSPPPPPTVEVIKQDEEEEGEDSDDGGNEGSENDAVAEGATGNMRSVNGMLSGENQRYPRISSCSMLGEDDGKGEGKAWAVKELTAAVRRFREGFVRLEKRRVELMLEMERDWMEMEAKRVEMVVESQRRLADTIAGAFHIRSAKKPKKAQEM